ncbi:MAG: GH92 family glycosyl hydrolase [Planctomycetota bacterium]
MTTNRAIDWVCPAMGTSNDGNCLIGPYLPMGMVRIGPDGAMPNRNNGYAPGDPILGISINRTAGTGGPPRYGHLSVSPFVGEPGRRDIPPFIRPPLDRLRDAVPAEEKAAVGYYSALLKPWNIRAELTATHRVGIHRYTFPQGAQTPHLLITPSSFLKSGAMPPGSGDSVADWDSAPDSFGGWMEILNDCELMGRVDFRGSWGHDKCHSTYFFIRSDVPFEPVLFANRGGTLPARETAEIAGQDIRLLVAVPSASRVELRIGISFVSVANARESIDRETGGCDFDGIRKRCEDVWEDWLGRFDVSGGSDEQRRMFYTMLYRILCMPTDLGVDEENPFWKSGIRQFTDIMCLWDSIRNANSFFHLFDPDLSRDQMNALLDVADHSGWLPDAHIANRLAYMQSACACDILYPEAARKGVQGVDYSRALTYLRKNCEQPTPDVLTRGRYIDDYHTLGYLSTRVPKGSVSRHLEYCYHDWCIAQLANHLGDSKTAETYEEYSRRVWNLWNENTLAFQPRHPNGDWVAPFDAWHTIKESWNDIACYEGTAAAWSLNVFQDFDELIKRFGGESLFIDMLDRLFDKKLFAVKETRMHIPHLYTYAGRPDRAADRVRESLAKFSTAPNGIPDNEDMGCQSGFLLWHSMGLYPIYGQTHYMLTPPVFDSIKTRIGHDAKHLTITVERRGQGRYIRGCRLGDRDINRAWVRHDELTAAERIHFLLDDEPSDWGTSERPPKTT